MCKLFPCIPIFRGFFWLKSVKRNVFAMGLKNAMLPMKSVFINVKKGISELGASLAANHTIIVAEVFLKLAVLDKSSALNKSKAAIPPLFNGPEVLPSASGKVKLFAKNFSMNSIFDDSGISLPVFSFRTTLKLHNISVTPKMFKKVITNLDLSKASGTDCIPMLVL